MTEAIPRGAQILGAGPTGSRESSRGTIAAFALALLLSCWPSAVGLLSPHDVGTHDQGKQVMYVVGAMDGALLVPHDRGEVATKPPLYTWLAAAIACVAGLDETTVRMPSVLASIALGLLAFGIGARWIGAGPALLALALFATTGHVAKLSFFARTDMLLAFFAAAAIVAYSLRRTTAFWICVGLGTMTKGPPGIAVPLAAVALHLVATRDAARLRALRPLRGLAIVVLMVALWLIPALLASGDAMRTMIREEFFEQMTGTGEYADVKHQPFFYLLPYLFLKLAPWSVAMIPGLRDAWRSLRAETAPRRDDDVLLPACWLLGGLFVFLFPATKRPDHLLPMYVPAALLAGRALWPWLTDAPPAARGHGIELAARVWALVASALAIVLLPLSRLPAMHSFSTPPGWLYAVSALALLPLAHTLRPRATRRARLVAALIAQSLATLIYSHTFTAAAREAEGPVIRAFAAEVSRQAGPAPIAFVETSSIPLQFLLQRNVRELSRSEAVDELSAEEKPAWLIAPEAVLAALAADPTVGERVAHRPIVTRSAPRLARDGMVLALVRVAPAANGDARNRARP